MLTHAPPCTHTRTHSHFVTYTHTYSVSLSVKYTYTHTLSLTHSLFHTHALTFFFSFAFMKIIIRIFFIKCWLRLYFFTVTFLSSHSFLILLFIAKRKQCYLSTATLHCWTDMFPLIELYALKLRGCNIFCNIFKVGIRTQVLVTRLLVLPLSL